VTRIVLFRKKSVFVGLLRSGIGVLAILSVGGAASSPPKQLAQTEQTAMTVANQDAGGQALKSELRKVYEELKAARKLAPVKTDITQSVLPYVAPGNSFQDAEITLRAAGFTIPPYPKPEQASDPNRPQDWYAVVARISPFVESFPFKVSVYVTLLPKSPGDYTSVEKVTAHFFVSGP
jgi:hypothetical protein